MRLLIVFLLIIQPFILAAQNIRVSVFNSREIQSFTVNIKQGRYLLKKGNEVMGEYKKGSTFSVILFGDIIEVRDKRDFIGNFQTVEFESTDNEGIISVNPVKPAINARDFDDHLFVSIKDKKMLIVNRLDLEKYIAAVMEAEGGNNAPSEYYKAQAVLIRTFTIKNLYKHAEEGFNLCDEVHCQAYRHRCSQHPAIIDAALFTEGKVLTDKEQILIMSPFHSNCGGNTSASGTVWQKDLPYLIPVIDPFCTASVHASWSYAITKDQWNRFLKSYMKSDIDYKLYDFSFNLPRRARFIAIHGVDLNLRTVREYFGLKSAYFSIVDTGDSLYFKGRGYGHGVGMCQEGAMEMARVGYSWQDIVHFYFRDVEVTDYREMELQRYKPE